jgi:hypothetical protein
LDGLTVPATATLGWVALRIEPNSNLLKGLAGLVMLADKVNYLRLWLIGVELAAPRCCGVQRPENQKQSLQMVAILRVTPSLLPQPMQLSVYNSLVFSIDNKYL